MVAHLAGPLGAAQQQGQAVITPGILQVRGHHNPCVRFYCEQQHLSGNHLKASHTQAIQQALAAKELKTPDPTGFLTTATLQVRTLHSWTASPPLQVFLEQGTCAPTAGPGSRVPLLHIHHACSTKILLYSSSASDVVRLQAVLHLQPAPQGKHLVLLCRHCQVDPAMVTSHIGCIPPAGVP